MAYLTDEIDEGATRRRLDEITTAGLHALDERAERSARIDEEFRQAQAKMEDEARAMDKLVADSHAKREADADKDEEPAGPNLWANREAKPTVLSFFGDEEAPAQASQPMPDALPAPHAALPVPIPPPMPAEPEAGGKVMSLGYEEDEPQPLPPAPPPPPARHSAQRQAPPGDDDDLSTVNWMR